MSDPLRVSAGPPVGQDLARLREALLLVLEALEDGDPRHVEAIAAAAFDGGPIDDRNGHRRRCSYCGFGPAWPGELEHHQRAVHWRQERAA